MKTSDANLFNTHFETFSAKLKRPGDGFMSDHYSQSWYVQLPNMFSVKLMASLPYATTTVTWKLVITCGEKQ